MKKNKIYFALLIFSFVIIFAGCRCNQKTVKEKVNQANFVIVDLPISGSKSYIDLNNKYMYGDGYGVREDNVYTYKETFKAKWLGFNRYKKIDFLYPIVADNTTVSKVRASNYMIVKDVNKYKEIIDIWHGNGYKGHKMKVFYNHDCLPIKVQMVDDDTNKWKTIVKYSYFKSTPEKYERNWKNYVKKAKAGYFLDE